MVDLLYSIGYSGFSIEEFLRILKEKQISLLVDVRSQPYSQYFPDYNKENLERRLRHVGIHYRNYAEGFGARQKDLRYYTGEGYLDFELFSQSSPFTAAFNRLVDTMAQGYRFALMCAEKDPINCHRAILITRAFHNAGYRVIHLLPNGKELTQVEIENRLLEQFFPDREQFSLFNAGLCEEDYIKMAYKRKNAEIGYSITGGQQ